MPFTVSLKEHLEMFELRKFLLQVYVVENRVLCGYENCFRNRHDDKGGVKHTGVFSSLYLCTCLKPQFWCFLIL